MRPEFHDKNGIFEWDAIFRDAHLYSGPNSSGLTIGKNNPAGSRGMWEEDKDKIHKAAKKYGYTVLVDNHRVISFFKSK